MDPYKLSLSQLTFRLRVPCLPLIPSLNISLSHAAGGALMCEVAKSTCIQLYYVPPNIKGSLDELASSNVT